MNLVRSWNKKFINKNESYFYVQKSWKMKLKINQYI